MNPNVPVAALLPVAVRQELIAASRVDRFTPAGESEARAAAVDAAAARARKACPHLFKQEN